VLYTSTSISLAFIEILVHSDESELPPNLFVVNIEINDSAPIYEFPDSDLPKEWREPEDLQLKKLGDKFFADQKFLGIKVRSAVLPDEWNILLNPQFPSFKDYVKITSIDPLDIDKRFLK
jgi:RES domain-containing protein